MGGLAMPFHMELSPDPACAQADDAVIYIPEAAILWLPSTTAPRASGRRLDNQDLSLAATGGTGPLIRSDSLAIAASAIFGGKAGRACGTFHGEKSFGKELRQKLFVRNRQRTLKRLGKVNPRKHDSK
jgi:hypothetical protein